MPSTLDKRLEVMGDWGPGVQEGVHRQVSRMPRCMAEEGVPDLRPPRGGVERKVYIKHNNGRKNEVKTKVIIMKVKLLTIY